MMEDEHERVSVNYLNDSRDTSLFPCQCETIELHVISRSSTVTVMLITIDR